MTDISVIGSLNQDLIFSTQQFPAPGETRVGKFNADLGGKGLSQAVAAHRLGAETLLLSAIGADSFAQSARAFVKAEGLNAKFETHDELTTGAASVVVDSAGENLIVVAPGANAALSGTHVTQHKSEIESSKVILVQLESSLEACEAALKAGATSGAIRILNPDPIRDDAPKALFDRSDIVTPNETEFAHYLKALFGDEVLSGFWFEPEDQLHRVCQQMEVPTVVITLGEMGCFVSHNPRLPGRPVKVADKGEYYRVLPPPVDAVDTTGAGDVFNGALAVGVSRFPEEFSRAVHYACAAAALSTEKRGRVVAIPAAAEVQQRFPELP